MGGVGRGRYVVLWFMCLAMGVLPLSWSSQNKFGFAPSIWGRLATIFHLFIICVFTYATAPSPTKLLTLYCVFWIQIYLSALVTLLLILTVNLSKFSSCLSTAFKIYKIPPKNKEPIPIHLFSILIISPFVSYITTTAWVFVIPLETYISLMEFSYAYTSVASIEVVISTLCFIAARTCSDINYQLKLLNQFGPHTLSSMVTLLDNYITVCKFVKDFVSFFGCHLFNSFMSFILRMICYAVLFRLLYKQKYYGSMFSYSIHGLYMFLRLYVLCYSCQKVKVQMEETPVIIRRLRLLWVTKLSNQDCFLMEAYEDLMLSTSVEFSACGLFPVNMQQVLTVLGTIITYGLVAVQG